MIVPISVELLDSMGSDLDVTNAARVSFEKESEWDWFQIEQPKKFMPSAAEIQEGGWSYNPDRGDYVRLNAQDAKLLSYLAKHNHWSPFSHCYLKFRIKAPIFCARQLMKSSVGLSVNEVSRRYVSTAPEFWLPEVYHSAPDNKKQGSGDKHSNQFPSYNEVTPATILNDAYFLYTDMIEQGYAPEEARMFLPQNTMTSWIWSGSLYAFCRVVNLRTAPDAQKAATQTVAHKIAEHVKQLFPVSYSALCEKV